MCSYGGTRDDIVGAADGKRFLEYQFDVLYYYVFYFRYISPGGNSRYQYAYVLNIPHLEELIEYIAGRIQYRNSAVAQRRLMTPTFRKHIIKRDKYTCQNPKCNNSVRNEPNLLLEVDHIIPISRGGKTTEDNLQTLCWRCNRSKGAILIW